MKYLVFEVVDNNGIEGCDSYHKKSVRKSCNDANIGIVGVARLRLGKDAPIQTLESCENFNKFNLN